MPVISEPVDQVQSDSASSAAISCAIKPESGGEAGVAGRGGEDNGCHFYEDGQPRDTTSSNSSICGSSRKLSDISDLDSDLESRMGGNIVEPEEEEQSVLTSSSSSSLSSSISSGSGGLDEEELQPMLTSSSSSSLSSLSDVSVQEVDATPATGWVSSVSHPPNMPTIPPAVERENRKNIVKTLQGQADIITNWSLVKRAGDGKRMWMLMDGKPYEMASKFHHNIPFSTNSGGGGGSCTSIWMPSSSVGGGSNINGTIPSSSALQKAAALISSVEPSSSTAQSSNNVGQASTSTGQSSSSVNNNSSGGRGGSITSIWIPPSSLGVTSNGSDSVRSRPTITMSSSSVAAYLSGSQQTGVRNEKGETNRKALSSETLSSSPLQNQATASTSSHTSPISEPLSDSVLVPETDSDDDDDECKPLLSSSTSSNLTEVTDDGGSSLFDSSSPSSICSSSESQEEDKAEEIPKKKRLLSCGRCKNLYLVSKLYWYKHVIQTHGREERAENRDLLFTCKHCPKQFGQKKSRNAHQKTHAQNNTKDIPAIPGNL